MVRGLCPRDRIRVKADVTVCTVGDAVAIGHAQRMRLTRPGSHANAGRRGRRPLRAEAKPRYQHRGKQLRKGNHLHPPLGSPERGAVAALCAVTEGLVQRGWGAITLSVNRRRRTGDGAPYDVWGTFPHRKYVVRQPTEGASGTPPPTGCAIGCVSAEPWGGRAVEV